MSAVASIERDIRKVICHFIQQRPGISPSFLMVDVDTYPAVHRFANRPFSDKDRTGYLSDGRMIIYGLTLAAGPNDSGLTVVGLSE